MGRTSAPSAHSAAADDREIALAAVVGTEIALVVVVGTGIAPAAAGSWDTANMAALPAVMGIPVVAETAAAAVVALAAAGYTVVDTRSSQSSTE